MRVSIVDIEGDAASVDERGASVEAQEAANLQLYEQALLQHATNPAEAAASYAQLLAQPIVAEAMAEARVAADSGELVRRPSLQLKFLALKNLALLEADRGSDPAAPTQPETLAQTLESTDQSGPPRGRPWSCRPPSRRLPPSPHHQASPAARWACCCRPCRSIAATPCRGSVDTERRRRGCRSRANAYVRHAYGTRAARVRHACRPPARRTYLRRRAAVPYAYQPR
jgi:hypothetical protein